MKATNGYKNPEDFSLPSLQTHPPSPLDIATAKMALAYPEGECFFVRSSLVTKKLENKIPYSFDANNLEHFYKNMLIEYVWNRWADHGSAIPKDGRVSGRSIYHVLDPEYWSTNYAIWGELPISYGPAENNIKKHRRHDLCDAQKLQAHANMLRDHEKGAALQVCFSGP